jgi:DNA-binding PadR family transcriptional regulator
MSKKLLRMAFLQAVFLSLIDESTEDGLHGYAIFEEVRKRFDVNIDPSTLYPELKLLKKQQLIEPRGKSYMRELEKSTRSLARDK